MNTKDLLKKYWFVLLIGVVLIVFVVAWAVDSNANKPVENAIQTKQVDGKDVLFEVDGNPYTADEFYDLIGSASSVQIALDDMFSILANKEIKSTEAIKTLASNEAQYYILNYTSEQLEELMRSNGLKKYANITAYFEESLKKQELIKKYFKDHDEDILTPYLEGKTYKKVSHILVTVADVSQSTDDSGNTTYTANPTEEESAKINEVIEALKTKSFAEVAAQYSDDGSAANGGFLGCSTDEQISSSYVKPFADAAIALPYGQQSAVVTSEYGYHIILVEEATHDDILEDTTFLDEIFQSNNNENYIKLLVEYSRKHNFEIVSDEIKEVFEYYVPSEESTESTETESAE